MKCNEKLEATHDFQPGPRGRAPVAYWSTADVCSRCGVTRLKVMTRQRRFETEQRDEAKAARRKARKAKR